jgi:hypothetical protein
MEDIRAAQESEAGSLDNRFRIERSMDGYTRSDVQA